MIASVTEDPNYRHRGMALRSCHGIGKTTFLAVVLLWFLNTHPLSKVPTTAPTNAQLRLQLWSEIAKWFNRCKLRDLWTIGTESLRHKGAPEEWFAVGRTSNKPANLEGFHAPFLLYIVDEAKGVEDDICEAIDGALTEGGSVLFGSTPGSKRGKFYQCFARERAKYQTMHLTYTDSTRVKQTWVDDMRDIWGEDSPVFIARVLGNFPEEGSDVLIPLSWIEAAIKRTDGKAGKHVMGIDCARFGQDSTVMFALDGARYQAMEKQDNRDTMWIADRAHILGQDCETETYLVDDSGIVGVVDALRRLGRDVVEIHWQGRCARPEYFLDFRAEAMWCLRDAFREQRLSIPDDPTLIGQCSALLVDYYNGRLRVMDKRRKHVEESHDMPVKSPDHAHALCLANWGVHGNYQQALIPADSVQEALAKMRAPFKDGLR